VATVRIAWLRPFARRAEDTACSPGDGFPVAELATRDGVVSVSAMICFDREFPESARALALGGAELILVPNACELGPGTPEFGDARLAQLRERVVLAELDLDRVRAIRRREAGRVTARRPSLSGALTRG
jgi:predicted amidohydrolase